MVEVEKTYLVRRNEDNLHLNNFRDPACNLTTRSNETHLVAVMALNACGTLVEVRHINCNSVYNVTVLDL